MKTFPDGKSTDIAGRLITRVAIKANEQSSVSYHMNSNPVQQFLPKLRGGEFFKTVMFLHICNTHSISGKSKHCVESI